jgi:DNA-binding MarR family transcriptional regulator
MSEPHAGADDALVWLIHDARAVYREAVRRALADAGCNDVPRNGAFVLAGLGHPTRGPRFRSQADVVAALGLSKQAASQLIDTLVLRDYVVRRVDPDDRRRMEVHVTERGQLAADAVHAAMEQVNMTVSQLLTAEELRGLRAGLAAFRTIDGVD